MCVMCVDVWCVVCVMCVDNIVLVRYVDCCSIVCDVVSTVFNKGLAHQMNKAHVHKLELKSYLLSFPSFLPLAFPRRFSSHSNHTPPTHNCSTSLHNPHLTKSVSPFSEGLIPKPLRLLNGWDFVHPQRQFVQHGQQSINSLGVCAAKDMGHIARKDTPP